MATDDFADVEIVDVEPDPTLVWSGETIMVKKKSQTSVLSGGVNLLNTVIGAGILSIPFAMARQGLIFGTFLVLGVAFLTHLSMTMLSKVGERLLNDFFSYSAIPLPDRSVTPSSPAPPSTGTTPRLSLDGPTEPSPRHSLDVVQPEAVDQNKAESETSASPTDRAQSPAGIFRPEGERSASASLDLLRTQTPGTAALNQSKSPSGVLAQHQTNARPAVTFPWVAKRVRPWLAIVLDIAIIIFCLGVCVAYLILIGDSMPQVIGFIVDERPSTSVLSLSESASSVSSSLSEVAVSYPALRRRELWISIAVVIVSPFAFAKRLDVLKYLSWGTVLCVAYMLIMLIYYFIHDFDRIFSDDNSYNLGPADSSAVNNISVIIFSYTCQPNFFAVFDEIGEKNRRKRANGSSALACTASATLYSLFGIIGYFIGGKGVASNVVNSLPTYDTLVLIARVALIFVVTFSFPVIFHPMRVCVESMCNGPRFQRFSEVARRIVIAAILLIVTFAISMIFEQLDVVLALTGATGATFLSFILPGYVLWLAFPESHKCPGGWFQIAGIVLSVFGVIFMVASVVLTFVHM